MSSRNIIEAIQHISGTKQTDTVGLIPCTVTSINQAARTCACNPQGDQYQSPFSNVLLMAAVDDGLLYIPTVGSTVLVTYSKFNQPYVCMFSSLDKILCIVGGSTVNIIDGTIQFNNGGFGGLAKVAQLTQKLNNLENTMNDLISKYNAHTHLVPLGAGTATAAPTTASEATTLTLTQQSDIENTAVKHGT